MPSVPEGGTINQDDTHLIFLFAAIDVGRTHPVGRPFLLFAAPTSDLADYNFRRAMWLIFRSGRDLKATGRR
jgi:hypothetical protein